MFYFFLDEKYFSDEEHLYQSLWKPITRSTSWCLEWSRAMVTLCLHSFSYLAKNSTQRSVSNFKRRNRCSGSRGWLLEYPIFGYRTLNHATQAVELRLDFQKISVTTPPKHLAVDYNRIDYYVYSLVELESNKTLCNNKHEPNTRLMAVLTNLNKEIAGKACIWRMRLKLIAIFWIHFIIIMLRCLHGSPRPSLDTRLYHPSLPGGLPILAQIRCI